MHTLMDGFLYFIYLFPDHTACVDAWPAIIQCPFYLFIYSIARASTTWRIHPSPALRFIYLFSWWCGRSCRDLELNKPVHLFIYLFIQPAGALSCQLRLFPLVYLFIYSSCPILFRSLTMSSVGFLFIYLFTQSVMQSRNKCTRSWVIYLFIHSPTRSTRWSCCTFAHSSFIYLFIRLLGQSIVCSSIRHAFLIIYLFAHA